MVVKGEEEVAEDEAADECQIGIYQGTEQPSTTTTAGEFTRERLAEMFDHPDSPHITAPAESLIARRDTSDRAAY